jgi:hypothetical protein
MTHQRFGYVKSLYKQVVARELIILAEDKEILEDEDEATVEELDELTKMLKNPKETTSPTTKPLEVAKPTEVKPVEEKSVPLSDIIKQVKEEPKLPHRTTTTTEPTLFDKSKTIETTEYTPGGFMAKICPVCGSFNYPINKTECSRCKRDYTTLLNLIHFEGFSPKQAIDKLSNRSQGVSGVRHLGTDALRTIWENKGSVVLPNEVINVEQYLEDKKGLKGTPNRLKLQDALYNKLNVEKEEKEIIDRNTGKVYKVNDVKYSPDGLPVTVPKAERDYFGLFEVSNKLRLTPSAILKGIADYNVENNKDPMTQADAIKPAYYIDDLNQAFSWNKAIVPVFEERIKEVFEMNKNEHLAKLHNRKEYLKDQIERLKLVIEMQKQRQVKLQDEIKNNPDKDSTIKLFSQRQKEVIEELKKANYPLLQKKSLTDKEKNILAKTVFDLMLNHKSQAASKLELKVGETLTRHMKAQKELKEIITGAEKRLTGMINSLEKINEQAKIYLDAIDKIVETIKAQSLDAVSGKEENEEDISPEELEKELMKEKVEKTSAYRIFKLNKMLKLAEEEEFNKPLPGQLSFPGIEDVSDQDQKLRGREVLREVYRDLTEEEKLHQDILTKKFRKSTLTHIEALNRLKRTRPELVDDKDLTLEQKIERNNLLTELKKKHPTDVEIAARLSEVERIRVPFTPGKKSLRPREISTDAFENFPCEHCGKKKVVKNSGRCIECGFISKEGTKQVIIEKTIWRFVLDSKGNKIPKRDEAGNLELDNFGNVKYKKRPEKSYALISIEIKNDTPISARAQKMSATSEQSEVPKIKEPTPVSQNKQEFRPVYDFAVDEKTGKIEKKDTGEKKHKLQCIDCPEPWKSISAKEFELYPTIQEAVDFIQGKALPNNVKGWLYKEVFSPEKLKSEEFKKQEPTILPTGSRRNDIMKLAILSLVS